MAKATWNGVVLAESDAFETVEGNTYFPMEALKREYFVESDTTSVCSWKGTSSYLSIRVNGEDNPDAAWFYPSPKPEAANIKDHVAFWRGVKVEELRPWQSGPVSRLGRLSYAPRWRLGCPMARRQRRISRLLRRPIR